MGEAAEKPPISSMMMALLATSRLARDSAGSVLYLDIKNWVKLMALGIAKSVLVSTHGKEQLIC